MYITLSSPDCDIMLDCQDENVTDGNGFISSLYIENIRY